MISALLVMLLSLVPFMAPPLVVPLVVPGMARTLGAVVTIRDAAGNGSSVASRIPRSVPPAWLPA